MARFFESIKSPRDIKKFSLNQLEDLSDFLREKIINTISRTGGHLASSLGTVELTVALHYAYDSPRDRILWDVGHQCYAHKLLTERMETFDTIRQHGGLSGFTRMSESCHDAFGTGHSSTSISAAVGIATARDLKKEDFRVIAVIGDGAMTGGMAFEAMNHAGHLKKNMIVILNDNEMSISKNVGALAKHFSYLRMAPKYVKIRKELRAFVRGIPRVGKSMLKTAEKIEDHLMALFIPNIIFEALGFTYLGPFDGHSIPTLIDTFQKADNIKGPILIHVNTQKGRGYLPAEKDSTRWHGALPFDVETGNGIDQDREIPAYSEIFCNTLMKIAEKDERIVAITAAMPDGTGLIPFQKAFPHRTFDVGIAEPHAVTFAGGLAVAGMKPVVAIYSTFLQRAYDQVIHDICLQNLPVVFIIDRGGIVGEDGPTHHGVFDLSILRTAPNMIIMAPKDENELQQMIKSAFEYNCPVAIRYPRGKGVGVRMENLSKLEILKPGSGEIMHEGKDLAILAVGSMVYPSILSAEKLSNYGIRASVVNMRFIKPLDMNLIAKMANNKGLIVTAEENCIAGGFGSGVSEAINLMGIRNCRVKNIGVPDRFIEHGNMNLLREKYGLTSDGIVQAVRESIQVAR